MTEKPCFIPVNDFYNALNEHVGVEASQEIIQQALSKANLPIKDSYPLEDALRVCDVLKTNTGIVRVIGTHLRARFLLRKI